MNNSTLIKFRKKDMAYSSQVLPFNFRQLADGAVVALSSSSDHVFLTEDELSQLLSGSIELTLERQAELRSRFFLASDHGNHVTKRLLMSHRAAE